MSVTSKQVAPISADQVAPAHGVSFAEAFKVWLRVALLSFDRPAVLCGVRALDTALAAVTAAVAGVILNLATWFGVHMIFRETVAWQKFDLNLRIPVPSSIDVCATMLAIAAALAIFRFKVGPCKRCSAGSVVLPPIFGVAS